LTNDSFCKGNDSGFRLTKGGINIMGDVRFRNYNLRGTIYEQQLTTNDFSTQSYIVIRQS